MIFHSFFYAEQTHSFDQYKPGLYRSSGHLGDVLLNRPGGLRGAGIAIKFILVDIIVSVFWIKRPDRG